MHVSQKRFYVKIDAGPSAGGNPCVYHNKDFPFELFMKWKWYFDYRAAFYKVQHPKHRVDVMTGSYDYVPAPEVAIRNLKNKIIAKKRVISKYRNKIQMARNEWNELFPIDEYPLYTKAMEKINRTQTELNNLMAQPINEANFV
ncbi:MAG: hypothetical protein ABI185_00330 [Ginsengibacter sp.]